MTQPKHPYKFKKENGIWYRQPTRGGRWSVVPGFLNSEAIAHYREDVKGHLKQEVSV